MFFFLWLLRGERELFMYMLRLLVIVVETKIQVFLREYRR